MLCPRVILDFGLGRNRMNEKASLRILNSCYDNLKSKIQNLKWLGLSVIAFVLVVTGAVADA
jgi:hypothetical protein